jgi:hypothetical protein
VGIEVEADMQEEEEEDEPDMEEAEGAGNQDHEVHGDEVEAVLQGLRQVYCCRRIGCRLPPR